MFCGMHILNIHTIKWIMVLVRFESEMFDMEVKKVWNWFDEYVASMNLKTSLLWIFQNTLRTPTTTGLSISVAVCL